jgi:hypothetical protein
MGDGYGYGFGFGFGSGGGYAMRGNYGADYSFRVIGEGIGMSSGYGRGYGAGSGAGHAWCVTTLGDSGATAVLLNYGSGACR